MDEQTRMEAMNRFWFCAGQIAYANGLSVDDACGFPEGHFARERFLLGWSHAQIHNAFNIPLEDSAMFTSSEPNTSGDNPNLSVKDAKK